jgi:hypothetical protein
MLPGIYTALKKDGNIYYRTSITYNRKHISLGSYQNENDANKAYLLAKKVLLDSKELYNIDNYPSTCILSFHKWIVLINFRDHRLYFKNPIYLKKHFFFYYIDWDTALKFDIDDLFYYAHHKIIKRGRHMFVSDYGMQVNILSRYGIKNFAVLGRDYLFVNGDPSDYRYSNISIINQYYGVSKVTRNGIVKYMAKIHIKGNYVIGYYKTEVEAAIAYNKAAMILKNKEVQKNFPQNYIDGIDEITYASFFQKIRISKKIISYTIT